MGMDVGMLLRGGRKGKRGSIVFVSRRKGEAMAESLELIGKSDDIFQYGGYPRPFAFNEKVADVFDDMVVRSVPLYADVTRNAARWALSYYQEGRIIYDIGCSTGTTLAAIAGLMAGRGRFVGIDSSRPMIDMAAHKLKGLSERHELRLICGDALVESYPEAAVVIANYTLQFLPVLKRGELLARAYAGLSPGGLLFVSEKCCSPTPEFQETMTAFYEGFKAKNGYSASEIARKKEALENVLVPLTSVQLERMVVEAGFAAAEPIMRWHNFVTFVALKKA